MSNSIATPWTVALQAPLSMGFPRQEYWTELPCPPPGNLPDPRKKPQLLHYRLVLNHWPPVKPHNGLLLSHKKEWNCVICRHIDRPRDCHTELSQKEKNKYHIIYHSYVESRKMVQTNLSAKQKWRYRHREQTYGYQGESGGGMTWEIGIDIYTLLL